MSARIAAFFVSLTLFALSVAAQIQIAEIKATGLKRWNPEAVAAATGLRPGSTVSREDVAKAAQQLIDTGLFRGVNFQYEPKPSGGYTVTFAIAEDLANTPAILDIPGIPSDQLWKDIRAFDPLLDAQLPDNERAIAYYKRAIETLLEKRGTPMPLAASSEADLRTGKMSVIFHPLKLPTIGRIDFEGNQIIPSNVLLGATGHLTIGQDYSERELRRILDLNLKPLYEERAHLTASFSGFSMTNEAGAADIGVKVDEGPEWTLGLVSVEGDGVVAAEMLEAAKFREGKPANWKEILASISAMERVFRSSGYLGVSSDPVREYRAGDAHVVDLDVRIRRGRQFFFGALDIQGLNDAMRIEALKMWGLKSGDPMNALYVGDYARAVVQMLKGKSKLVSIEQKPRPGTADIDVMLKFK